MLDIFNSLPIIFLLVGLAILPLFVVTLTSFLKIAIVLFLVRNALGIQQTPPNIALYAISLILMLYISSPVLTDIYARLNAAPINFYTIEGYEEAVKRVEEPVKSYLSRFVNPNERQFFMAATEKIWAGQTKTEVRDDDFLILMPAFVSSELTRAFEIGFLIYLPFLVIDLIVSNILMAMGMIMVSPTLISIPLKLFLFVTVDGWSRLLHGLILSYGN
ncbi:MAG: type III secretion system export apparatus subunit SctR [Rhodomicrobium sp.]|nr:type III secretion system export apparatus subunit SctR [Rhodomicrobium sp.]